MSTEQADRVARDNHACYLTAVGPTLCSSDFKKEILNSPEYGYNIRYGNISAGDLSCIIVDCSNLDVFSSFGSFATKVKEGILGQVATRALCELTGNLNEKAVIEDSGFKFNFEIIEYERDSTHNFEIINDPMQVPVEENLARIVKLSITCVSSKDPGESSAEDLLDNLLVGKTILLVEDTIVFSEGMSKRLRKQGAVVLVASTLEIAEDFFSEYQKVLDLVVMDACVNSNKVDTVPLIKRIVKSGHEMFIVAASSSSECNKVLMKAGATHNAERKHKVVPLVIRLLRE